jgi:CSLREA domain-containing protein
MSCFPSSAFETLPVTLFLAITTSTALATDFTVTTGEDQFDGLCDAHCSLRDAVQAANDLAGPDRILLGSLYILSLPAPNQAGSPPDEDDNLNGDLDIRDELIIRGQSEELTEIRGEGSNDRIIEVLPAAKLTLERLKVSGGSTSTYGGALENHGQARLSRVTLTANEANADHASAGNTGVGHGGAIANYGDLSIFSSTFTHNRADGGDYEGFGGVLYNQGALLVRDSLFQDNRADAWSDEGGRGGVLYNLGHADLSRSSFIHNWAGELGRASALLNAGAGVLKVTNSTFSQNYPVNGSGVITNEAPNDGGTPSAELINVTIADNLGNGLFNGGKLLIRNSLVAGNKDGWGGYTAQCRNFGSAYSYKAVGLLLGATAANCTAELYVANEYTLTRLLHPLSVFDERTHVHALRKYSPALDAGIGSCTRHDQRRRPRPRDGDGDGVAVCDLGAYERARP